MNTLSRQPQLALSAPFERMRDFRDSLGIDDVNLPLSTVSDQTRASDRRRVGIVYNPETARVSGELAQIFDRFIPQRFQSVSRNIVAALKHGPSRPIRTSNDPEFSMSHKAAGYELECFKTRPFASVNAAMSSEVNSSDSGSIGCCRSSKKRTKSSASCCKRGDSVLAPSKICSATLTPQSYHYCWAMSPSFQYPLNQLFAHLVANYQQAKT